MAALEKKTFSNFIEKIPNATESNKLPLLCNYVSASVYQFISEAPDYSTAIATLDSLYVIKRNEILARRPALSSIPKSAS